MIIYKQYKDEKRPTEIDLERLEADIKPFYRDIAPIIDELKTGQFTEKRPLRTSFCLYWTKTTA